MLELLVRRVSVPAWGAADIGAPMLVWACECACIGCLMLVFAKCAADIGALMLV